MEKKKRSKKPLFGLFAKVGSTNYCRYIKIGKRKMRICSKKKPPAKTKKKEKRKKLQPEKKNINEPVVKTQLPFKLPSQIKTKPEYEPPPPETSVVKEVRERKILKKPQLKARPQKVTIMAVKNFSQKQLLELIITISNKLKEIDNLQNIIQVGGANERATNNYICQVLKYKCYLTLSILSNKIDMKLIETANNYERINFDTILNVFELFYPLSKITNNQQGGSIVAASPEDPDPPTIMKKLINNQFITNNELFNTVIVQIFNSLPINLANIIINKKSAMSGLPLSKKLGYISGVEQIYIKSRLAFFLSGLHPLVKKKSTVPRPTGINDNNNDSLLGGSKSEFKENNKAQFLTYNLFNVTEWLFTDIFNPKKQ